MNKLKSISKIVVISGALVVGLAACTNTPTEQELGNSELDNMTIESISDDQELEKTLQLVDETTGDLDQVLPEFSELDTK